ncbi:hypothetical protein Dred_2919 [Desulforamulus reducens MI-1]|uniref:Uncharacterized protein n=1 Tax=Desulforamulus reducens (strain ATCC BAA-1160 / DSM 100696 / MI-1) TaxID=349161 RepID=A4J8M0_DESRM|nr:hypothetical protein [Desulforamulus reducens]ABO51423.1 hypothetical protein Dred_2919 [Desulforamulus reducens MI-1]
MNISPGERTIYAFFNDRVAARSAAEALQEAGFELPFVDRLDRHTSADFLEASTLHPEGFGEQLGEVDFNQGFFFTLKTKDDLINKAIGIIQKHEGFV